MAVANGNDYLFFPKVDCSKQSLTAAMAQGCAVLTPNCIFMLPKQSFGSFVAVSVTTKYSFGGGDPVAAVEALLADPDLDVSGLETTLNEILGGTDDKTRWVFPLDELEKFKMKAGFFGTTTLKMPGESVRRLVIRGKGGKKAAMDFYKQRVAS